MQASSKNLDLMRAIGAAEEAKHTLTGVCVCVCVCERERERERERCSLLQRPLGTRRISNLSPFLPPSPTPFPPSSPSRARARSLSGGLCVFAGRVTEQQASLDLLRAKYKKAASNSEDFELMHEKAKRQVCVRACVRAVRVECCVCDSHGDADAVSVSVCFDRYVCVVCGR